MRRFLLIILTLPFVLLSQNKTIVFVEGGTSTRQSFYPKENVNAKLYNYFLCATGAGPAEEIGYSDSKIKRSTTTSFYSKIGIEPQIVQKKHFSLSLPFIFGYREQKESILTETKYVYYSGVPDYYFSRQIYYYYRVINLCFGPKITMSFNRWSYFTSLYLNTDLFCYGKTISKYTDDFKSYYYSSEDPGDFGSEQVYLNLSLQNGVLYNLSEKIAIGLTNDVFFYNISPDNIRYNKKENHLFNFGYGTNSTIINSGIRLQYSF